MDNSILNNMTIGEFRELQAIMTASKDSEPAHTLNDMIGQKVIIRCYSAGNWFGTLQSKCKHEVILTNARRLHGWTAAKGISLSEIAKYGLREGKHNNRICSAVDNVWLEAIEIIPCTPEAIDLIESREDYQP